MVERTKMYLISSDKDYSFGLDPYFAKKIKSIFLKDVELDALFAENFKKFPIVSGYCMNHGIETIEINFSGSHNYYLELIRYIQENSDKKNLASLIYGEKLDKLKFIFKMDEDLDTFII